jgi:hypothetical protein
MSTREKDFIRSHYSKTDCQTKSLEKSNPDGKLHMRRCKLSDPRQKNDKKWCKGAAIPFWII